MSPTHKQIQLLVATLIARTLGSIIGNIHHCLQANADDHNRKPDIIPNGTCVMYCMWVQFVARIEQAAKASERKVCLPKPRPLNHHQLEMSHK